MNNSQRLRQEGKMEKKQEVGRRRRRTRRARKEGGRKVGAELY